MGRMAAGPPQDPVTPSEDPVRRCGCGLPLQGRALLDDGRLEVGYWCPG